MPELTFFLTARAARRADIHPDSVLLKKEMQQRQDEIAIDLEDRSTKKGTPPIPTESGDIRALRNMRSGGGSGGGGGAMNGLPNPQAMVE